MDQMVVEALTGYLLVLRAFQMLKSYPKLKAYDVIELLNQSLTKGTLIFEAP